MKNSEFKDDIENVEKILLSFPERCRINFYDNLNTLEIKFNQDSKDSILGNYNPLENIITLNDKSALCHELFHVSFNNSNLYNKEIEKGYFIDNGISLKSKNGILGHALTEGFAEYLSRKCKKNKGKNFEFYFSNLLILIYGEEILEYALENDPIGFISEEKFNNIVEYMYNLDQLEELLNNIIFITKSVEILKIAVEKKDNNMINKYEELISLTKDGIPIVILNLFNNIVDEYNFCDKPKVSKDVFIKNINDFFQCEDYNAVFRLCDSIDLKNKIKNVTLQILKQDNSKLNTR